MIPHPDDVATIQAVATELRQRRLDAGVSLHAHARHLGLTASQLCLLERHPTVHIRLSRLNALAAGVGAGLVLRMVRRSGEVVPVAAGGVMAAVRDERFRRRLTVSEVAALAGCTSHGVRRAEVHADPMLAAPMWMCRALGGRFHVALVEGVDGATA